MVINMPPRRLSRGTKRQLQLLAASLALTALLPASVTSAEEATPTEEIVSSQETIVEAEATNESVQNWLESEDYIFAAERIPTNRWDTPANIHVITAEEIENNHYQDVWEVLSHINGVTVTVESSLLGFMGGNTVNLNGTQYVLLLVNGRRVHNPQISIQQAQKSDLRMIPSIKMIERIEIVKGGYSALYGSDAVGGIINIITKKGTRDETTIDINEGSWLTHNYEVTNQGTNGKLSWFVTAGVHRRKYYKYRVDNQYDGNGNRKGFFNTEQKDATFSLRLDHQFDDRSSLTLTGMHRSHHYNYYNRLFNHYNDFMISYNFKEGTSTPSWLRYYNYLATNDYVSSRLQAIEYQNGWEFGRHKIIAGFEWHQNKLAGGSTGSLGIKYSGKESDAGFYIQDTMTLGNKWTVIPGVRFDHNKDSGNNWSPKISVNYRADDKTKFYGSWGRVYNPPSNI